MQLEIEQDIPLADEILGPFESTLANDFLGYRNHVYRMINFCFAQGEFNDQEREQIVIAGCFHDLGIWTGHTFDYLPPSIDAARRYLYDANLERWTPEIELMIDQHHKVRKFSHDPRSLVEVFRRGDLADFSLGLI